MTLVGIISERRFQRWSHHRIWLRNKKVIIKTVSFTHTLLKYCILEVKVSSLLQISSPIHAMTTRQILILYGHRLKTSSTTVQTSCGVGVSDLDPKCLANVIDRNRCDKENLSNTCTFPVRDSQNSTQSNP